MVSGEESLHVLGVSGGTWAAKMMQARNYLHLIGHTYSFTLTRKSVLMMSSKCANDEVTGKRRERVRCTWRVWRRILIKKTLKC